MQLPGTCGLSDTMGEFKLLLLNAFSQSWYVTYNTKDRFKLKHVVFLDKIVY